jgi:hypothetical protein
MRMDEVKVPSALGITLPPAQQMALMKGMAVLQENRWKSIDELVAALYGGQTMSGFVPPTPMPTPKPYTQPNSAPKPVSNQRLITPEPVSKIISPPGNLLSIAAVLLVLSGSVYSFYYRVTYLLDPTNVILGALLCSIVGLILGIKGKRKNIEAGIPPGGSNKVGIIVSIIGLIVNLYMSLWPSLPLYLP